MIAHPWSSSSVILTWNPVSSTLAGLCLGTCVHFFNLFYGRVLGISGIIGELVNNFVSPFDYKNCNYWRLMFTAGLLTVGFLIPNVPEALPFTNMEAISSGILVAAGVSLGNGCSTIINYRYFRPWTLWSFAPFH